MSVINQMLKDLDARGHGDASRRQALASVGQGAAAHRRPSSVGLPKILGLLSLFSGLGVLLGWVLISRPGTLVPASASGIDGSGGALAVIAAQEPESIALEPAVAAMTTPVSERPDARSSVSAVVPVPTPNPAPSATLASSLKPEQTATFTPPAAPDITAAPAAPSASVAPAPAPASSARIERIETPPPDPLAEVREALANGDAGGALSRLAALPSTASTSGEGDALTAAAHQLQNAHAEAITAYTRALRRHPDMGAWWAGLGISFEAEGRSSEALSAYREALRRGPLEPALADYLGGRVDDLAARDSSR